MRIVQTNGANRYLMMNMMYCKMQNDMEENYGKNYTDGKHSIFPVFGGKM